VDVARKKVDMQCITRALCSNSTWNVVWSPTFTCIRRLPSAVRSQQSCRRSADWFIAGFMAEVVGADRRKREERFRDPNDPAQRAGLQDVILA